MLLSMRMYGYITIPAMLLTPIYAVPDCIYHVGVLRSPLFGNGC